MLTLIIVVIIIPVTLRISPPQSIIEAPKGAYIKDGNRIFYNFLEKVKQTNSLLVLGTSETGNGLNGNNYYSLLNRDSSFNKSVYAFGGAGRCSNVYFPLILDNPEALKKTEIIYYINPTYWRKGLNRFDEGYFNRYVSKALIESVKKKAIEEGVYSKFMKSEEVLYPAFFVRTLIDFKSLYYYDLNNVFVEKKKTTVCKNNLNTLYNSNDIEAIKNQINLEFNVTEDYLSKNLDFPQIDTSTTYQYDMLETFIHLVKKYNINCTFYLGPYNEIYCMKKNPEYLMEYREVLKKIKTILLSNKVDFIDGSDLSTVSGTFIDVQHISEYGAYLTALQIKKHYEKNN